MIYFYQFIFFIVILLSLPVITPLIYFKKIFRKSLGERLGLYPSCMIRKVKNMKDILWVHCASVGEIKLLKSIEGFDGANVVITSATASGKKVAMELFPDAAVFLMPLDFTFLMKRFTNMIKPKKILLMESEFWPGLLWTVRNIPVTLFNGRISAKKFRLYLLLGKSFRKLFDWIDVIYPQDEGNFNRFKKIGVSLKKLKISVNLKYNFSRPSIHPDDTRFLKVSHPVWVCGSSHRGEEKILIDVFNKLKQSFNDISLILSPRHLERVDEVGGLLRKSGIKYSLWSEKTGGMSAAGGRSTAGKVKPGEVILVDKMGELSKIYSVSTIAFVGGTLVDTGGHNIIEAIMHRVPVVVGRYPGNFKSIIDNFSKGGGLKVARNVDDLYNIMMQMLGKRSCREGIADIGFNILMKKKLEVQKVMRSLKV